MRKGNICLYDTEAEYLVEKDSFELPNVSLVEDINEVFYNPFIKNDYLKLKYNVTSTSEATPLINESYIDRVEEIIIDGEVISPLSTVYTFNTLGDHDVWFKFTETAMAAAWEISGFFRNTYIIEIVEIPTELDCLTNGIFNATTNLVKVNLYTPNGKLREIGSAAFSGCDGLTKLVFPNSVNTIRFGAFSNCDELKEVIFSTGLTIVDTGAFQSCTGLAKITSFATTAPTIDNTSLRGLAPNGTLYVPYGCTEAYTQWMSTEEGYLGAQGWTIQELPQE